MDKAAGHFFPALGVVAADDDDIRRYPQIAQRPMQAHRLLCLVGDFRLDDKKVDIAPGPSVSASMGTKENDLRFRSSRSQATRSLRNQILVNYLHNQIVVGISVHLANKASRARMERLWLAKTIRPRGTSRK